MPTNNKVFDWMNEVDPPVDFTGASAQKYIDKYTNRPEDAGTIEGIQNILGVIGIVADPADWVNASIYASKGDIKNTAIYGSGLGIAGSFKIASKLFQKIQKVFGFDKTEKAFEHISSLGFSNFDEYEDWMILKSETDEVFRKEIGSKQIEYFAWLKKHKEIIKSEKLHPKNINLEDIMKSDNPLSTFKKAVEAGNPQAKSMMPESFYPKYYDSRTRLQDLFKKVEAKLGKSKGKK